MPHLRLQVPQEWLREDFIQSTGFDAAKLLDHLVEVVAGLRMPNPAASRNGDAPAEVPLINKKNLKHALMPVYHAGVAGDLSKGFLHATFAAGNDTPGRTAEVRMHAAEVLGDAIDEWVARLPKLLPRLASVTVHVQDIDRDRGYTTTASRRRRREQQQPA